MDLVLRKNPVTYFKIKVVRKRIPLKETIGNFWGKQGVIEKLSLIAILILIVKIIFFSL